MSTRAADGAGLVLVAAFAGWTTWAADAGAGHSNSALALCVAGVVAAAAGRCVAERDGLATFRVIAIGVAGAVVLTWPAVTRSGGAPTGYANANAALAGLGVIAAVAAAAAEREAPRRRAWWIITIALGMVLPITRSLAGVVCLGVALALLALSLAIRRVSVSIVGGAIAVVLALGGTVAIAKGADPLGLGTSASVRAELWSAAADLAHEHPLRGVGPGRFSELSDVSADRDLRWAHHGYLQLAAEAGIPAFALALLIVAWGYGRLALAAIYMPHRAAVGAAGVTLVALHATVDHVMHHPEVLITLAAMVGATTARRPVPGIPG